MEILEIIVLVIAWIVTLSWMYGMRLKLVTVGTALVSLTILVETLLFTFVLDFSDLHLLWVIPASMYLGTHLYAFLVVNVPILGTLLGMIGKTYSSILLIGKGKDTVEAMRQQQQGEMKEYLDKLAKEKFKTTTDGKDDVETESKM